ncbi:Lymphocyte antigen 6 complex locus protein G5b [Heterocephalus glaber]|uniref:Lymphocyte antigen 6 complex locus protein G5b n=1 Tax=Heterocephalus glaber TaxID=10181 RepID=G5C3F3_HETGA|nr:Lymphocyte antigen 6 complex locus protein G5b [Heterocephalus glaber]
MKGYVLVDMLVMVGFALGKVPVPEVRTCHFCLLEDPAVGCISGSEKCTISSSSPCMVISIYYETRSTYFSQHWYQAHGCQYNYCNSWTSPQLQSSLPELSEKALALPLSNAQVCQFYQALNLSLPLPSFHAGKEPEGLDPLATLPLELGLSVADLCHRYLFFGSSGLLDLPRAGP